MFGGAGAALTTSTDNNRYTYTGREWDKALGLYHYRARIYDSISGRFLGRDPLGYVDGDSLYLGYFVPTLFDPFGTTTTIDGSHDGFDPEWLESSGCYDYCIASGHSPSRCHDYCNYDNPPSEWPFPSPHPDWPIGWGDEIPFNDGDPYPTPQMEPEQNGAAVCKCTFDRNGRVYPGYNVERPAGINGKKSQPGFTTVPCKVGKKAIMRYKGTCEKRKGKCECESTCFAYMLWECVGTTKDTPRTPGGTMWRQTGRFHLTNCE